MYTYIMYTRTPKTAQNPENHPPGRELTIFHQALQNTHHFQWCLVCLIDDQHPAMAYSWDQGRVLVDDHPVLQHGLDRQGLHRGVLIFLGRCLKKPAVF